MVKLGSLLKSLCFDHALVPLKPWIKLLICAFLIGPNSIQEYIDKPALNHMFGVLYKLLNLICFCFRCFWQNGSLLVDYTLDEIRKEADIKPLLRTRNAVFAAWQANDCFYHA